MSIHRPPWQWFFVYDLTSDDVYLQMCCATAEKSKSIICGLNNCSCYMHFNAFWEKNSSLQFKRPFAACPGLLKLHFFLEFQSKIQIHIILIKKFQIAYAAFSKLTREYGNVFSMKLGSSWCVVVNDTKTIKEVLITKGAHFDGRPNLKRFAFLFGGDKENCKHFFLNYYNID